MEKKSTLLADLEALYAAILTLNRALVLSDAENILYTTKAVSELAARTEAYHEADVPVEEMMQARTIAGRILCLQKVNAMLCNYGLQQIRLHLMPLDPVGYDSEGKTHGVASQQIHFSA